MRIGQETAFIENNCIGVGTSPLQDGGSGSHRVHPVLGHLLVEGHRHPAMDLAYQRVRRTGHDSEIDVCRALEGLAEVPHRASGLGLGPLEESEAMAAKSFDTTMIRGATRPPRKIT
jgi:hypothetical protein